MTNGLTTITALRVANASDSVAHRWYSALRSIPMTRNHAPERRGTDRPSVGEQKPCPACYHGSVEFTDRYRMALSSTKPMVRIPAWVCDSCRYARPVRAEHQPAALLTLARGARVHAQGLLMKSRVVRARIEGALKGTPAKRRR